MRFLGGNCYHVILSDLLDRCRGQKHIELGKRNLNLLDYTLFCRVRGFIQESPDTGRFDLLQFPSCERHGVLGFTEGTSF